MRTKQRKQSPSTSAGATAADPEHGQKTETLPELTRLCLENDRLASGIVRLNAENTRLTLENEGVYVLRDELAAVKEKLSKPEGELAKKKKKSEDEGVSLSTPVRDEEIFKVKEDLSGSVKTMERLPAEMERLGTSTLKGGEGPAIDGPSKVGKDEVSMLRGELATVNEELSRLKEELSKQPVEKEVSPDDNDEHKRAEKNIIGQQRSELSALREEVKRLIALNSQTEAEFKNHHKRQETTIEQRRGELSVLRKELKRQTALNDTMKATKLLAVSSQLAEIKESVLSQRSIIIRQDIEVSGLKEQKRRLERANDKLKAGNADLKLKSHKLSERLSTALKEGGSKVELQISNAELKLQNRTLREKLSAFQRERAEDAGELKGGNSGSKQKSGQKTEYRDDVVTENKEVLDPVGASLGEEAVAAVERQDTVRTMGIANDVSQTPSNEAPKEVGVLKSDIPEMIEEEALEDGSASTDWEEVSVSRKKEQPSTETIKVHTATDGKVREDLHELTEESLNSRIDKFLARDLVAIKPLNHSLEEKIPEIKMESTRIGEELEIIKRALEFLMEELYPEVLGWHPQAVKFTELMTGVPVTHNQINAPEAEEELSTQKTKVHTAADWRVREHLHGATEESQSRRLDNETLQRELGAIKASNLSLEEKISEMNAEKSRVTEEFDMMKRALELVWEASLGPFPVIWRPSPITFNELITGVPVAQNQIKAPEAVAAESPCAISQGDFATLNASRQSPSQPSETTAQLDDEKTSATTPAKSTLAETAAEKEESMLPVAPTEVARHGEFVALNVEPAATESERQMEQTPYEGLEMANSPPQGDLRMITQQLDGIFDFLHCGTTDALQEIGTSKTVAVYEDVRTVTEEKGLPTRDNERSGSLRKGWFIRRSM